MTMQCDFNRSSDSYSGALMFVDKIKIPRSSDRKIADFFKKLGACFGIDQGANVIALGNVSLDNVSLVEPEGDWRLLLESDSYLLGSMCLRIPGMVVTYCRGGQVQSELKSPIFDEIVIQDNSQQPIINSEKIRAIALINKELRPFEPDRVLSGAITVEQSQLLALHHSTLERLETLNEDLIRSGEEFRRRLEATYEQKIEAGRLSLEAERKSLADEFAARSAALGEEKELFSAKLKQIDDRDNTHARREIRDKMLEDVRLRIQDFGVSLSTEAKRAPVRFGIFFLIAIFSALLVYTAYEASLLDAKQDNALVELRRMSPTEAEILKNKGVALSELAPLSVYQTHLAWLWVRFAGYSLGLIATFLYYVRWENKWAEQHSANEFQLRQFHLDVSRANWVVESCLEWRKETGSQIPKTLLEGVTRNLFADSNGGIDPVVHPADELASALLGTASKVKLRVGENEIDVDKPGKIPKVVNSLSSGAKKS